jgi:hypothetical protein
MSEEPISLYIDLKRGETADIEAVARAALAFSAAIKDLIYVLDPSLEVRVEFMSGTEGSLSINSIIKSLKEKAGERPILAAAVMMVLTWFGNYAFDELMDHLRHKGHLSEAEMQEIADKVALSIERRTAQSHVREVYKVLGSDKAVAGVGATVVAGERPRSIIAREHFTEKAEGVILSEVWEVRRRSRKRKERVVIISPVLLSSATRRWRFMSSEGEFGAPIKDAAFLDDLINGRVVLPMTGGVELDVLMETEEEFQDGVWVAQEYTVWEVHARHFPPVQGSLLTSPPEQNGDRDQ